MVARVPRLFAEVASAVVVLAATQSAPALPQAAIYESVAKVRSFQAVSEPCNAATTKLVSAIDWTRTSSNSLLEEPDA